MKLSLRLDLLSVDAVGVDCLSRPSNPLAIRISCIASSSALEHAMSVVVLISHTGSDYFVTAYT